MSHITDPEEDLHDPKVFQDRKDLYRKQRDDFRSNSRAMEELREWKAKNDDYDYMELYVPMCPCEGSVSDSPELHIWSFTEDARNADCTIALHSKSGMIPASLVGKAGGSKPFAKSDTWFSVSLPYLSSY